MAYTKHQQKPLLWSFRQSTATVEQGGGPIQPAESNEALTTTGEARPDPSRHEQRQGSVASLNGEAPRNRSVESSATQATGPWQWAWRHLAQATAVAETSRQNARDTSDPKQHEHQSGPEPAGQESGGRTSRDPEAKVCREFAAETAADLAAAQALVSPTPILDVSLTFQLSSRPSASKIIYLDFNGHTTTGTAWNDATMGSSFDSPAYDSDGNPNTFSTAELVLIQQVWQRVAEDFAPFDVNVTLQEPPAGWLSKTDNSDANWGIRAVVTSYGPYQSSSSGVALVGSFTSSVDTPVFVYNKNLNGVCEAISHEVGHSLGLSHDGTSTSSYYVGHGGTTETSWAPIMGSSYNRNVTTWDDGTYTGSNNTGSTANYGRGGDDLAVITGYNGFSFRPDLVGNETITAAPLSITAGTVEQFGTIETRQDSDCYSFNLLDVGDIQLNVSPYWYRAYVDGDGVWGGTSQAYLSPMADNRSTTPYPDNAGNLDLEVRLYDGWGNLIRTANDPGLATSIASQGLSAGTYYLKLDGVGFGDPTASTPTGYSDYASIGNYMISGTITSAAETPNPPVITLAVTPGSVSEDGSENLIYTFTRSDTAASPLSVNYTLTGTASQGSDYSGPGTGSNPSVTFAANAATATVVVDPAADSSLEADETVSLLLAPGVGYSLGDTSSATGTIRNDDLAATPLVFSSGTDILIGTTSADSFGLNRLSDALWSSAPDRITNLQAGFDSIDSPFNRASAIKPKQLGMVQTLDAFGIQSLLSSKNFAKNGAATFTFQGDGELRSFLAINDANAGFKASFDSVIEITGYTGSLSTLAIF